jgi:hypothetical protein
MKKILMVALASAVLLTAGSILAADYSQYSTEELSKMRGTMQNVSEQERETFRMEWQKRIQNMTQEEREKYMGRPEDAGQGNMMKQRGMNQDRGYGMGGGKGMGGGGRR